MVAATAGEGGEIMWVVPPEYIVLDIETIAGDPSDAENWMRQCWKPAGNWKPETIGSRWLEALGKKEERLALIDGSPIISVAMRTPQACTLVHWLPCQESIEGAQLIRCEDERSMLRTVRDLLDVTDDATALVGHNVRRFDLPRLRRGMVKHGLRIARSLASHDQSLFDTMDRFSRFTVDERAFIGLAECLEAFGLPNHKADVSGEDVGRLAQSKQYGTLLRYAVLDVEAEHALFLRMTGQAPDVEVCSQASERRRVPVDVGRN